MSRATCRSCSAATASGHREVRLPGAGRADAEGHRGFADRVDVTLLGHGLRSDLLATVAPDHVAEDVLDVLGLVDRPQDRVDGRRADLLACFHQLDELLDDRTGLGDVDVVSGDRQAVPAQQDRALQPVPERLEDAVADRGELRRHVVRNVEGQVYVSHRLARDSSVGARGPGVRA